MRLTPVAIIADDLTGAADTAAVFARPTRPVPVSLRLQPPVCRELTAFAVTTESRGCSPAMAGDKMAEAIHLVEHTDHGLAYKKVDSNMRGNVGAELERIWQIQKRPILLCPAFPRRKRTVIDGRVFVDLTPLAETEIAQDPQSPVKHSYVADIIREQASRLNIGSLSLQELRRDAPGLGKSLDKSEVLVSDAETDGDLARLARAALSLPQPPVFCGSAGLAAALAQLIIVDHRESRPPREPGERIGEVDGDNFGPVLAVLASSSDTLERQVRFVERRLGVEPVRFACEDLSWDEEEVPELTNAIEHAVSRLRSGYPAVVQAVGPLPTASRPVDLIVEHLAHLAFVAVKQGSPSALLVGGGATAHAVLSILGTAEIEVEQELLPGLAVGTAVGGHFGDRPVALKPGAAGGDDALARILQCLAARAEVRELTAGEDK
ncbi:MAG: hypothetical protein JXA57_12700 [Armatimonadetes bacterium]|nr:hypothetical protein [Armatimonadota bacterium]